MKPLQLALFPVLALILVSGCVQGPGQGPQDRILPDGTILKPDGTMIKPDGTLIKPDGTTIKPDGTLIKPDGTTILPNGTIIPPSPSSNGTQPGNGTQGMAYQGALIAGTVTPYLRYNEADFNRALSEGKAVYVYFYATWCPICAAERPNVFGAFNELSLSNAIGFEAHWNDGQTVQEDEDLARRYGVAYQHTHLFIRPDGTLSEKAVSRFTTEQIKEKLTALAGA